MLVLTGEPPLLMTRVPARCSLVTAGFMASIITRGGTRVRKSGWKVLRLRTKL